jgi:hypothetical protein
MTLPEARRRVAVSRLIGWVMIVLMGLAALLILAKMTYVTLSDNMGLLPGVGPVQCNPLQPIFNAYPMASRVWDLQ